jgi:glycosyltransferase involved in cell wall biosynthesis
VIHTWFSFFAPVKVLILHQHFNTPEKGGAIRSYYLAKSLVDRGMKVVVITAHNRPDFLKENSEGIEIHYLPVAYDNRFGFVARSRAFLNYVWSAIRFSNQFKDADYCYAISVPLTVGLAAQWIKRQHKIPYIFEVGDLWPDAPVQMGFVNNYFFKILLYQLEKSIYRSADSVVALSPSIQSAIEKKVPEKKVHLVPNMADCDYYLPEVKNPRLKEKFNVEGKFVISYIGAIGLANGLDYLLECANASRKAELPIHFFICGDGALLDRLKGNVRQMQLANLTFINFTNRDGVKELLNVTDASFICYKPIPILETGSPNKFFDGLAAGKLILINFGGWIRKEIEENRCGIYTDPHQPTDFVKKIKPFLSDKGLLTEYQQASRQLAERKYSRKMISEEFVNLFK